MGYVTDVKSKAFVWLNVKQWGKTWWRLHSFVKLLLTFPPWTCSHGWAVGLKSLTLGWSVKTDFTFSHWQNAMLSTKCLRKNWTCFHESLKSVVSWHLQLITVSRQPNSRPPPKLIVFSIHRKGYNWVKCSNTELKCGEVAVSQHILQVLTDHMNYHRIVHNVIFRVWPKWLQLHHI